MKLIVGLGNLGEKYHQTRHNVGFMVVDEIAKKFDGEWVMNKYVSSEVTRDENIILAKPQTYMNDSGQAVKDLIAFYELSVSELIVVHDDLDIPLGQYKIQLGKGPKVHNGINSIESELITEQFWRVRVGIDNRNPNNRAPGEAYVLQQFNLLELDQISRITENLVHDIMSIVHE